MYSRGSKLSNGEHRRSGAGWPHTQVQEPLMHFERRLWQFTEGVRPRIAGAALIGLAAVALGMARLMLLAWLIAQVFAGRDLKALIWSILGIAAVMVLRGAFE